jgi:hypothetical protein
VAHAGVDHLGPTRRRPIAQTVAVRAEERAALDHLAGHPELRLARVVARFHRGPPRIPRCAAGSYVHLPFVPGPVPVRGPLPYVPGHVVESVGIGRERADGGCLPVAGGRPPRELPMPVVGQPLAAGLRLLTPGVGQLVQAAASGRLPLGLGGQSPLSPGRVRLRILIGDVYDGMILPSDPRGVRAFGTSPGCTRSPDRT